MKNNNDVKKLRYPRYDVDGLFAFIDSVAESQGFPTTAFRSLILAHWISQFQVNCSQLQSPVKAFNLFVEGAMTDFEVIKAMQSQIDKEVENVKES